MIRLTDYINLIGEEKDLNYAISRIDYKLDADEFSNLRYEINTMRSFSDSNLMEKYAIPYFDGNQIAPLFLGLEYLHLHLNILHYDLSMQNIMLDPKTDTLCLIDFGDSLFMNNNPLASYELSHSILQSDILTPGIIFKDYSFKTELEILVCFGLKFLGFQKLMQV